MVTRLSRISHVCPGAAPIKLTRSVHLPDHVVPAVQRDLYRESVGLILPESRHRLEDGKRGIRRSSWGILNRLQAERGVEVELCELA